MNLQNQWEALGVVRHTILPSNGKVGTLDLGGRTPVAGQLLVNGKPFANSKVLLTGNNLHFDVFKAQAKTGDDGSFVFWSPPAGKWSLYYLLPGRRSDWCRVRVVEVTDGKLDLGTIDCKSTRLAVRVVGGLEEDADKCRVRLTEYNPNWPHGNDIGVVSLTGVAGEYAIENVPAGTYELVCSRPDGLELRQKLEVPSGVDQQQVTLEWPPGKASVEGAYHGADGRPRRSVLPIFGARIGGCIAPSWAIKRTGIASRIFRRAITILRMLIRAMLRQFWSLLWRTASKRRWIWHPRSTSRSRSQAARSTSSFSPSKACHCQVATWC